MTCPACGFESPEGFRFCGQCGQGLDAGTPRPPAREPRAYTPRHLAEKILTQRSALEGERKQVTVLFADVKGSTELAERVDAEAWHAILDRFFQILTEGVHRFEGTVNQYTGDGIMALFGAPIAHEDHAQRACWAALHLRDALRGYAHELRREHGLDFAVRMGINSGEVVVGRIGDDLRMDYTAQGATVALAQRMEQLAEAGAIYLAPASAALTRGWFDLADLGAFRVRGAADPVPVSELRGVGSHRTRFDVSRARGLSRFVGREAEVRVLEDALERTVAGQGGVVDVVGEAGVGKSRLCHELAERCRARGIMVAETHAVAHGRALPLLPVLHLIRSGLGITPTDGDRQAREKIAGRYLLLDPALADELPLLFDFLGVPDAARPAPRLDPEALTRRLQALTKRYVRARSAREPAVLIFEDLHWIDEASAAWLPALVEAASETRTLLVTNHRPELTAFWRGEPFAREIALAPLGPEATAALLDELLGPDDSLTALKVAVQRRTAGNPFFTEEVVQGLLASGALAGEPGRYRLVRSVEEIRVPETVQAVLAARIDQLPERAKSVLQTAAVIGRSVPRALLAAVSGLASGDLEATADLLISRELLHPQALYPERVDAFRHPLTQEVAYRAQLGEQRARLHAAVARAVEDASAGRLDESAALLAHHCEEAGETEAAARWHARAADWLGNRDRRATLEHWRRVRALLDGCPQTPENLVLGVMARDRIILNADIMLGLSADDEASRMFAEGTALANRLETQLPRSALLVRHGLSRILHGAFEEGIAHLERARDLADEAGAVVHRFHTRAALAAVYAALRWPRQGLALCDEALAIAGDDVDFGGELTAFNPWALLRADRAFALMSLGRLDEAASDAARAEEVARARQDQEMLVAAHSASSMLAWLVGDASGALVHGRRAVEAVESVGGPAWKTFALGSLVDALALDAEWEAARETVHSALAMVRTLQSEGYLEVRFLTKLALAERGLGNLARGREAADRAVALSPRLGASVYGILAHLARAQLACDAPDAAAALRDLDAADALVEASGACAYTPFVHEVRAELARVRGDEAARRRELDAARRLFTQMGATARAERLPS